jgi:hypothetical protein
LIHELFELTLLLQPMFRGFESAQSGNRGTDGGLAPFRAANWLLQLINFAKQQCQGRSRSIPFELESRRKPTSNMATQMKPARLQELRNSWI